MNPATIINTWAKAHAKSFGSRVLGNSHDRITWRGAEHHSSHRLPPLQKRSYRMFGKHLNKYKLQKHIAKLRQKNEYWQLVGSQAVQEISFRIVHSISAIF